MRLRRTALGAAVLLLAGLSIAVPANAGPQGPLGSGYRNDPYLSPAQKQVLDRLAERSPGLTASSWPHGGVVGRMELRVPSGAPSGATLSAHATTFVTANGPLWNITTPSQLGVVSVNPNGDCSTVTLTLTAAGGTPVFNATLTVVLTPTGTVRGAVGHLSGAPLGEVAANTVTAAKATSEARAYVESRTGEKADSLPTPTQVVVDPFFLTDSPHKAGAGWLLTTVPGGTGQSPVVVVNGQLGTVTVGGPGLTPPVSTPVAGCPDINPSKLLVPYVIDPMTDTPAIVDFGQYGVPTQGADPVERAYDFLSQPLYLELFGDRDPRRHLRDAEVAPDVGGRTTVRFHEYFGDIPVEGARLSVSLLPNGNVDTLTARFVYFPSAATTPAIPEADAVAAATTAYRNDVCGTDAACLDELSAWPPDVSLRILSARIHTGTRMFPWHKERLTYKLSFPRRIVFWDAESGTELYGYHPNPDAIPHTISNGEAGGRVEIVNGAPPPGVTPHADATRVSNWLGQLDTFYLGLGRNGFDNAGGAITVRVRDITNANASWCRTPFVATRCGGIRMRVGADVTANDVVAHEFTHGVVEATTNYAPVGESGALHEHYGDVMASVVFPDVNPNNWLLGEDSTIGALRDLANPGTFGAPSHYGNMEAVCGDPAACVHSWAGIPNRAAVLVAQGGVPGSTHPGVGRPTLAALWLATLSSNLGGPSDLFLDELVNTLSVCGKLVAAGTVVAGRPLTQADCDHVERSFNTAGVAKRLELGWTRFSSGILSGDTDVAIRTGMHLFQGCTLANQILRAEAEYGNMRTSDVADGMSVNFANEWGANVTLRGAATDPTDRGVGFRVWTTWFQGGIVDVDEVYAKPPGLSDEDCRRPSQTVTRRALFSAERVSEWATFFDGGKGDEGINEGVILPNGCEIGSVLGVHFHDWGDPPVGAASAWLDHDEKHGFRINRTTTNPRALALSLHWWHSGISSIKARVQYEIFETAGTDCLVAGLQANP